MRKLMVPCADCGLLRSDGAGRICKGCFMRHAAVNALRLSIKKMDTYFHDRSRFKYTDGRAAGWTYEYEREIGQLRKTGVRFKHIPLAMLEAKRIHNQIKEHLRNEQYS